MFADDALPEALGRRHGLNLSQGLAWIIGADSKP
jgi:hypothetical protein